jgi:abortive infection bacteriophage resistance protein
MIAKSTKDKHPETFIKHYKNNYTKPINPPSWMCLEVLTLGQISKLFNGLKLNEDKQTIAKEFGLHHTIFKSWLHTITHIRNICGHHGRLWNREIAIEPLWLKKTNEPWLSVDFEGVTNRSFYAICIIKFLLRTANPSHSLKKHLEDLFRNTLIHLLNIWGCPQKQMGKQ